jgi:D-alanine-D-alanine ligase
MRIAFTHNVQVSESESEAEFDSPATVRALVRTLEQLGHSVFPVEVSGPVTQLVARLEALSPDLVFNTAEGRHGRFREAFYPALFEELGLAYTGSDPYTCLVTLDKQLTKRVVAAAGVPTPRWQLVTDTQALDAAALVFPVIVKPNFEGSSKGISQDSVVTDLAALEARLRKALPRYPAGLLVEQYIEGRDISVPFLELVSPRTGGVLPAVEYVVAPEVASARRYALYDYSLKHLRADAVSVRVPAELTVAQASQLSDYARRIYKALGIRDLGRLDFRVAHDGEIYFIEANALPSLEVGAGIYAAAAAAGVRSPEKVIEAILRSATSRHHVAPSPSRKRTRRKELRVGFTFNVKRVDAKKGGDDSEAEFDSIETIDSIHAAIESYGHEVVRLEATPDLVERIRGVDVDVVFNMAEGFRGRNREAQVPALLEFLDIPYTGSDPATLALTLDKALAKRVVQQAGVATPQWLVMTTGRERLPKGMRFPLIAKPVAEGSSKGVVSASVVREEVELRVLVSELIRRFPDGILVEEYLEGREFTVGLLGETRPKVLPPMEIVFLDAAGELPVYSFQHKLDFGNEVRYDAPAKVTDELGEALRKAARAAFAALRCRDVARIDLRLDRDGRVNFIECNPLPGLTPGWSDLCLIADSVGMEYRTLIGEILAPAIHRSRQLRAVRRPAKTTEQTQ